MTSNEEPPRFIVEGSLGRIAKMLRALGFDCIYDGGMSIPDAVVKAVSDNRIFITRSPVAETAKLRVFRAESQDLDEQIGSLNALFDLKRFSHPFSRCLTCGTVLEGPFPPDEFKLPPRVAQTQSQVWRCSRCNHNYWKGSHVERMSARLHSVGLL
jgi:uncharacterized protein